MIRVSALRSENGRLLRGRSGGSMRQGSAHENTGRMHDWPRFLCAGILFILVFWSPWQIQKNWQGDSYLMTKDTHTYVQFNGWTHPWRAVRSIGYPAFIYPFLHSVRNKHDKIYVDERRLGIDIWKAPEQPIYAMVSESGIAGRFEAIAFTQRVILALAVAVFYLSLCRWLSPFFSFLALGASLWLAPLPNPQ